MSAPIKHSGLKMAKVVRVFQQIHKASALSTSTAVTSVLPLKLSTVPLRYHSKPVNAQLLNCPSLVHAPHRQISVSPVLNKKVREELYEKVRVYDPNNNFICDVELIVLEKFCHTYHTYKLEETEAKPREGDGGNKLKGFQLKKKEVQDQGKTTDDKRGKHVKEIKVKANQDPNSSEWKLEKVLQVLLDMGVVNVTFVGKEPKNAIKAMTRGVQDYFKMAHIKLDGALMQITVPHVDTQVFKSLLDYLYTKEAAKLKSVQELIELEKDLEKSGS